MKSSRVLDAFPVRGNVVDIKAVAEWKNPHGDTEELCERENIWDDDQLLIQYYKDVTRYLGVFHINKAYIEDAVQDTMVAALIGADSIRDKTKSKYWILTVAKRIGLKYFNMGQQEEARNCSYEEYMANRPEEMDFISDRQLFEKASLISDEYLLEVLETALSERERQVVLLYYVYQHRLKDIARIMKLPESTIRSISARAKKKLKVKLEEGGYRHDR